MSNSNSNKEKKNGYRSIGFLDTIVSNDDRDVDENNDMLMIFRSIGSLNTIVSNVDRDVDEDNNKKPTPKEKIDVDSNLNLHRKNNNVCGVPLSPVINDNNKNCNDNNKNCQDNNKNCEDNLQIFNSNFAYGVAVTLLKSPEEGIKELNDILIELERMGRIDWCIDPNNRYMIEGRIYEMNDDAEFRCQIYRLEKNLDKAILEFSRTGGDSCAFLEFRQIVCNKLKECISNDCNDTNSGNGTCDADNDFDIDISSQQSFFSMESIIDIDFGIQELSISGDNNNINNNNNNKDDDDSITYYEEVIKNVKNRDCCREIYRDHIITLQHIITDTKKAKILSQLNNIFEDLLSPMEDGPNTLLDCWIIKNLLEIVCKLLPLNKAKCPTDKIQAIQTKWGKPFDHPLGIVSFFPSQQICRLCTSCLKVLEEKVC